MILLVNWIAQSWIPLWTCPISHNIPFRIEMCTFPSWMVHCGFFNLVYWIIEPSTSTCAIEANYTVSCLWGYGLIILANFTGPALSHPSFQYSVRLPKYLPWSSFLPEFQYCVVRDESNGSPSNCILISSSQWSGLSLFLRGDTVTCPQKLLSQSVVCMGWVRANIRTPVVLIRFNGHGGFRVLPFLANALPKYFLVSFPTPFPGFL